MNRIETEAALIRAAEAWIVKHTFCGTVMNRDAESLREAITNHKQAIRESHSDLAGCIERAKAKADERSEGDGNA